MIIKLSFWPIFTVAVSLYTFLVGWVFAKEVGEYDGYRKGYEQGRQDTKTKLSEYLEKRETRVPESNREQ